VPVTSCVTSCQLVIDWHCTMPPVLDRLTWVREQRGTPHHFGEAMASFNHYSTAFSAPAGPAVALWDCWYRGR